MMFGSMAAMAIDQHPRFTAVTFALALIIPVLLAIFGPEIDGPEKRAAYDRAKLDCRLAGGTYEYFGTQGYACIPASSSSSNRQ